MGRILYVLHSGRDGGTFQTNEDLMRNIIDLHEVFLLSAENDALELFQYSDGDFISLKIYQRNKKWSAKHFHNNWLSYIYYDIFLNYDFDLVHIRHLIFHNFDLPRIAKKLNIPVVFSLHDFYLICPFYILLNENKKFCKGICNDNSINCYTSFKILDDINSKDIINEWRLNVADLFNYVDYFVTTSDFVRDLFISVYPQLSDLNFEVIEHGRDFFNPKKIYYEVPSMDKPIKILCLANNLNLEKGYGVIKGIIREDEDSLLEFHFLGNCSSDITKYGINHGTFIRDEFYKKVDEIKPSFVGIFSIWPETFCHTITEAWSCGIPVIGSNIGVIQDRIIKNNGGWIIDINDYEKSYETILDIVKDKEDYLNIVDSISKMNFKSTKDMARDYLQIYNKLLK